MLKPKQLFMIFFVLFSSTKIYSTHIKAADLFAKINPYGSKDANAHRQALFTLNVYCDKNKVANSLTSASDFCSRQLANCATLDFGDGSSLQVQYKGTPQDMGNNTLFFVYEFFHIFPADRINKGYTVGYYDENRVGGIRNMGSGASNTIPLYISMELGIEAGLGNNQTPQLTIPPLDQGQIGKIFIHNPGAYDSDGDSVSYSVFFPESSKGQTVFSYTDPDKTFVDNGKTADGTAPSYFSVNSKTGDVIWNAPKEVGIYNIAFKIEEWRTVGRSKILLSYAIRDMQIEIVPGTNNPPVITLSQDVCVEAGQSAGATIQVNDPDRNQVELTFYGELTNSVNATLKPNTSYIPTPYTSNFSWKTFCENVQKRPYQVFFKATDNASTPLVDIKTLNITVVGPKPTGLTANIENKQIRLKWASYSCAASTRKAKNMLIYRRVGCDTVITQNCVTGAPNSSYVLIKTLPIDSLNYIDVNIKRGNVYSYVIAAQFEDDVQLKSLSYASSNVCIAPPLIAPIITNVSFEGTRKNTLLIKWKRPQQLDTTKIKGPYQYVLYKKIKIATNYDTLHVFPATAKMNDTSFLDTDIKTNTNYAYYVKYNYFNEDSTAVSLSDSSEVSTNVQLTTTPIRRGIKLTWQASTPWQNNVNLFHHIWRKRIQDTLFLLIDSVQFFQNVSNYTYDDIGKYLNQPLKLRDTVSYFVTTAGSYKNIKISPDTLLNNSFIDKNVILDTDPPCSPYLNDFTYDCASFSEVYPFKNALNWQPKPYSDQCDSDVVKYNIYYATNSESEENKLLATVNGPSVNSFIHSNLASVAGCYTVTALDAASNESSKSNKVCLENCYLYTLPNIFTPNGSGINDLFRPIPPAPRFVESVKFKVFNRWGGKVFEKNDDIYLNWDGSGVPDGIYFYSAKITYTSSDENKKEEEIKGWIQIVR